MFSFADFRFKSLDDIFYFGGQSEHQQEAIYKHKPAKHNQVMIPFLPF
jgi:glycoprotein 6-alpha-L-fucosyltransferase